MNKSERGFDPKEVKSLCWHSQSPSLHQQAWAWSRVTLCQLQAAATHIRHGP